MKSKFRTPLLKWELQVVNGANTRLFKCLPPDLYGNKVQLQKNESANFG